MPTELLVIALGGNAILQRGQKGTFAEQYANVEKTVTHIANLVEQGYRVVLTHGNGPQVGATLLRHEAAKATVPPLPLDVCGAETQGFVGYMLQQALRNDLKRRGLDKYVITVITRVIVNADDVAFTQPSKPVGPFYTAAQAHEVHRLHPEFMMREDAGRGWRRMVPSPEPQIIAERRAIRALVDAGFLVVACGGGGIPIVEQNGHARGVDAVIDKDLAGERLATLIQADRFLILTDVAGAFLHYGTPNQRLLARATPAELHRWYQEGQFKAGSMGPKVLAAARFVEQGGREAIIAQLDQLTAALETGAGTHVASG